jgi:hypothetical protein
MKRLISSILILLTIVPFFVPFVADAQTAASCSSINTLSQYSNCCDGSSSDSLSCKNFALKSGGAGSTTSNSCSNVSTLAQYSSCCSGSPTDSAACKTFASSQQSNSNAVSEFNPNVNFTQGNTYGGVSISGIGGAIASCTNVGSFLNSSMTSSLLTGVALTEATGSASAFVGSGNPVSTSDSKTQTALANQNQTTQCLDGIAYAVAKNALAQITNKTLNWVNTGLKGNPLYVQNENSYLGSIKNQQAQLFLGVVQESDPIFGNALRSSLTFQLTGNSGALGALNTPLNTPQAQAYNSFQADFTNGGWDALLNPAYNSVGAYFNAIDTLNSNIESQQQAASNEIQRNNGFLDMKSCTQYANNGIASTITTSNACSSGPISSDTMYETCCTGNATEDSASCNSYATADAASDNSPQCASITDDTDYSNCCNGDSGDSAMCVAYNNSSESDDNTAASVISVDSGATNNGVSLSAAPVCTQYSTTTPGSIIASQVQSVTNSPVQQLTYADKINEVLGGFFDSFVNKLLSKGLHGSGSGSSPVTGIGSEGDNAVTASGTDDTSALGYQASGSGDVDTGDFDISRPQQLRAILQTQEDFLNRTYDSQIALERIVPAIGALDYCIPGPNPDYQTGLDSNWQTFLSSVQQAPANSPSIIDQVLGALPGVGGILSIFFDNSKPPPLWLANSVLNDKATGGNVGINRTFYDPGTDLKGTTVLTNGLDSAYTLDTQNLSYYNLPGNTFDSSTTAPTAVGDAFIQASANDSDPQYVHGFLQDAYTETDGLVGYNEAATTIDQQYNQTISDTQNAIEQLTDILSQVDTIVAQAKAQYIQDNPSVNVQCLDQAYIVDTSAIVPVARQEPNPAYAEEDLMVQHSIRAANHFYTSEAI